MQMLLLNYETVSGDMETRKGNCFSVFSIRPALVNHPVNHLSEDKVGSIPLSKNHSPFKISRGKNSISRPYPYSPMIPRLFHRPIHFLLIQTLFSFWSASSQSPPPSYIWNSFLFLSIFIRFLHKSIFS